MKNIVLPLVPLVLSIVLVAIRGVQSTSNVTAYMDDYIRLNQQQFDGVLKEYETILANAKTSYIRELRAIDVQIDLLAVKLEEATERLRPIHLIDSWHKQCVKDNSPDIPLIVTVRTAMSTCSTTALNQLTSYLSNCQSDYNSLKSYYTNTLKNALSNCEKNNSSSQLNYSTCITTTIANANRETINNRKNFNTHWQQTNCSTELGITQAWECAFTTVFNTSSTIGTALRLVDDCIANRRA